MRAPHLTEISGTSDVITFRKKGKYILYEFYKTKRCEHVKEGTIRVIKYIKYNATRIHNPMRCGITSSR